MRINREVKEGAILLLFGIDVISGQLCQPEMAEKTGRRACSHQGLRV